MPDSIYLKGCPLCGHQATLKKYASDTGAIELTDIKNAEGSPTMKHSALSKGKWTTRYRIVCNGCGFQSFYYSTTMEAITAWNRRPDPRDRRAFPKGPWKYYPTEDGEGFIVAQTNAQLEMKKELFRVIPDPSAHISELSIEAMMRVVTASQSMYEHLYETFNMLTDLLAREGENLNQKDEESKQLVTKLANLRASIELQLAGIDGASVSFDPENDTPVLSRLGKINRTQPDKVLRIAKISQEDAPPPDFSIDNANVDADEGEYEEDEVKESDEVTEEEDEIEDGNE